MAKYLFTDIHSAREQEMTAPNLRCNRRRESWVFVDGFWLVSALIIWAARDRNLARVIVSIRCVPILLLLLVLCSGCGTIFTHSVSRDERETGVYQGVRFDCEACHSDQPILCFLVFDLPLSLAADTLVLPYDITYSARNKESSGR